MEKGTKEILKNIAIIVLVPTALVGAYYGFKFVSKKIKDKKLKSNEALRKSSVNDVKPVDTTGMSNYIINIPFKLQKELFTNGEFYDAIKSVNYSHMKDWVDNDEKNNPSMIKIQVMALPKDLNKLNDIVQKVNKEISIVTV